MPVTQETTSGTIPVLNTEISFGTLTALFDYLDVYVDASTVTSPSRIKWRLYVIFPGVRPNLVVESLAMPCNQGPYLPFGPIQMIAGATYEIRAVAVEQVISVPIIAGFAGSNASSTPPSVASGSFVLSPTTQTVFATVPVYHSQYQVQVDPAGQNFTASTWRLLGTITGAAGSITAEIAIGQFSDSGPTSQPYIVISTANSPTSGLSNANFSSAGPAQPPQRARGAGSYSITGISLDSTGSIGPVNATLIGFDHSCCGQINGGNQVVNQTGTGNQAQQGVISLKQ